MKRKAYKTLLKLQLAWCRCILAVLKSARHIVQSILCRTQTSSNAAVTKKKTVESAVAKLARLKCIADTAEKSNTVAMKNCRRKSKKHLMLK